ncbi:MAG: hypothetical protein K9M57_06230 [Phycisphaerae bacterium]|nr:hypothetical protein [Phycisphaerae bacterium]
MAKHKWAFKACFRREAYAWNGSAKAAKRMKEAVSEIKKVARTDTALAGEGTVELFVRLYPASMRIDGSSGALGAATSKTIDTLIPVLIQADWDMNTRGKWLDLLYKAILEDGWGTFDGLRDQWGELCVYPGLAHLWADKLIPDVKEVFTSIKFSYSVGTDMCLSCLLFTGRYDELSDLLQLQNKSFWSYNKFWAMALVRQEKYDDALGYAEQMLSQDKTGNDKDEIDRFCESLLMDRGKTEEAYEKYGLNIPTYGTYLNIYRAICKKYPMLDKKKILLDCIEKTDVKGKWFASAKNAGFLDIAAQCARSDSADPNTLLRACRDFADKDFPFALVVGVQAIVKFMTMEFYDPITATDIIAACRQVENIAENHGKIDDFKAMLSSEIMKQDCKPRLREIVVKRLGIKA